MARRRDEDYDNDNDFPPYVPVAERRRKAALAMAKLEKKGVMVSPVKINGRVIASTFWGKAWCDNLERYRDYENRLERGQTYVRNGSVVDLQVTPRVVTATVSGTSLYKVKIDIDAVPVVQWKAICRDCASDIDSLVELLQGRFAKGVMERICRQGEGLFPKPAEIRFSCSCPDQASMCKHVAAVLYGVGARLDEKPELLFRLRAVDEHDLVADIGAVLPLAQQGPAAGRVLETDDMAALFGLDMGDAEGQTADAATVAANTTRADKARKAAKNPVLARNKMPASEFQPIDWQKFPPAAESRSAKAPTPVKPVLVAVKTAGKPVPAAPAAGQKAAAGRVTTVGKQRVTKAKPRVFAAT
jgi:uncharacterized Zn finger protein